MRGPHPDRGEARAHGAPRPRAPRHGAPRRGRQLLGQGGHAEGTMALRPAHQGRRPPAPTVRPRWQGRAAGRPHGRLGADCQRSPESPPGKIVGNSPHPRVESYGFPAMASASLP
jgi:hypothetical protein